MRNAGLAVALAAAVVAGGGLMVLTARSGPGELGAERDGPLVVKEAGTLVNRYTRVRGRLEPGERVVRVAETEGFHPGDRVLLLQAPGEGEGAWELARVSEVGVEAFLLEEPLVNGYAGAGVQAVRVPEYTWVTVLPQASIVAAPWDGRTGGVVAFFASETLRVDGEVVAGIPWLPGKGLLAEQGGSGECLSRSHGRGAGPLLIRAGRLSGSGLLIAEGEPRAVVGAAGTLEGATGRVSLCVAEREPRQAALPVPAVESPAHGGVVGTSRPVIRGRLEQARPGAQVYVYVDGVEGPPVAVGAEGRWVHMVPRDLPEGVHTVLAEVEEGDGRHQRSQVVSFAVDARPPRAMIDGGPLGPVSVGRAEFRFSAEEPGVQFECSVDGGAFRACQSPLVVDELGEGGHVLAVRARDGRGRAGEEARQEWVVDRVAPEVLLRRGPEQGRVLRATEVEFEFGMSEPGGRLYCSLDGRSAVPCGPVVRHEGLGEGEHVLAVYVEDEAGNRGQVQRRQWRVDATPPETRIGRGPPPVTREAEAVFEFSATEPGARYECDLGSGQGFRPCASPLLHRVGADGLHELQVRAVDEAGNVDGTPLRYSWVVDRKPPETQLVEKPSPVHGSLVAHFQLASPDAWHFECRLEARPRARQCPESGYEPCWAAHEVTVPKAGQYRLCVRARDQAGNVDPTPVGYSFTVKPMLPRARSTSGRKGRLPMARMEEQSASFGL